MATVQAIVFWTAVLVAFVAAIGLGGNRPYFWLPMATLACTLLAVQLLTDVFEKPIRFNWRLTLALILYLGVLGWAAAQTIPGVLPELAAPEWSEATGLAAAPDRAQAADVGTISIDPVATWHGVLRLVSYAALFLIAYAAGQNADRARRFIDAVAVWGAAVATYGLVAHVAGENPILGDLQFYQSLEATFINRNAYAFYAGVGLTANVAALSQRFWRVGVDGDSRTRTLRLAFEAMERGGWLFLFGMVACAGALLLTESRAGVAVGFISVALFLGLFFRRRRIASRDVLVGVGALAALIVLASIGQLIERIDNRSITDLGRALIYPIVVDLIADRPWTGYGLGAFADAFRPHAPREIGHLEWDLAHNTYLENALELGLVAAAALTLAIAIVFLECLRGALKRRRRLDVPSLAVATMTAGALHSLVDFPLQMPATAAMMALIMGVGCAQAATSRET